MVQFLQIVLRATQTLYVQIFSHFHKKMFCLLFSSVQFSSVQSEMYVVRVNSFLPDNLSEGKKIIFRPAYKMCLKCKYQLKPITISRHMVETKPWNWLKVYSLKYGFEVSKPLIWDITQNSFYVLLQKCLTFSS